MHPENHGNYQNFVNLVASKNMVYITETNHGSASPFFTMGIFSDHVFALVKILHKVARD